MALLKDYPWKGYTPQHWRIIDRRVIEVSEDVYLTMILMGLWKNKATYQSQTDIPKRSLMLPAGTFEFHFDGDQSKSQCYELVKITEFMVGGKPNPMLGAIDDN